jgi:hypothetical protein
MRFEIVNSKGKVVTPINRVIELLDDETFKVRVYNNIYTRVQLDLYMNGKVGNKKAWVSSLILSPFSGGEIERGLKSHSQFTFKAKRETDLSQIISTEEDDWGLVCVRFRDEYFQQKEDFSFSKESLKSLSVTNRSTGGVVGSGYSDQEFGTTHPITKYGSYDEIFAYRLHEKKYTSLESVPNYNYP